MMNISNKCIYFCFSVLKTRNRTVYINIHSCLHIPHLVLKNESNSLSLSILGKGGVFYFVKFMNKILTSRKREKAKKQKNIRRANKIQSFSVFRVVLMIINVYTHVKDFETIFHVFSCVSPYSVWH